MIVLGLVGALLVAAPPATPADAVTLRDGKVVLGQVVEPAPPGRVAVIVRRAWAKKNLPERFRAWESVEAPTIKRARQERLKRLEAWWRDRDGRNDGPGDDPIGRWLGAEVPRLKELADQPEKDRPPLMMISLRRNEIRKLQRRSVDARRMLRQGWKAGFPDVESKSLDRLKSALEGRGLAPGGKGEVAIDELLPIPIETDARWLARRAATEVAHDRDLRFIRAQGLVLAEGQAPDPGAAVEGVLKGLLGGEQAVDPMEARLHAVAARGRIGAIITQLNLGLDGGQASVRETLMVRTGPERWELAINRAEAINPNAVEPGGGDQLADDPQIAAAFKMLDGLGLGNLTPELKQQGLAMGAATQRALARLRTVFQKDLDALALPVDRVPEAPKDVKAH